MPDMAPLTVFGKPAASGWDAYKGSFWLPIPLTINMGVKRVLAGLDKGRTVILRRLRRWAIGCPAYDCIPSIETEWQWGEAERQYGSSSRWAGLSRSSSTLSARKSATMQRYHRVDPH